MALGVALLAVAGCGPTALSADVAKQECFANQAKIKTMYTDPVKIRVNDKGHPEGCPSG